jgi:hypothetical protein
VTVAKAKFKCVILVKSILVAQFANVPLQLSKYITAFVAGVAIGPASPDIAPLLEPELAPLLEPELVPLLELELAPLLELELAPLLEPELAPLLELELVPPLEPELVPLSEPELGPLSEPAAQAGSRGTASSAKVRKRTGRTFMDRPGAKPMPAPTQGGNADQARPKCRFGRTLCAQSIANRKCEHTTCFHCPRSRIDGRRVTWAVSTRRTGADQPPSLQGRSMLSEIDGNDRA